MDNVGKVIFSFDFEIGWGDVTNGVWLRREQNGIYKKLRTVLPKMLASMDSHEIPVTWATVGAMIEHPSERDFSHLAVDQLSVIKESLSNGQSDTFDGIDLFESVLNSKQKHTIACHSYSHIPFDYEGVDGTFVSEELRRFNRVVEKFGLSADSFVFPENTEDFHAAILAAGYRKVRVPADNLFRNRYLYLASLAVIPPPPCKEKKMESGLVRHYGSMLFNDAAKPHRIPLLNRRVSLGLRKAVNDGSCLHIWAHPFNFAESDALLGSFQTTLSKLARLRDQGRLEIALM